MNTPAHLIFGAAAFGRPGQPGVTLAALFGALLPDLSLYVLVGWSLLVMDLPPQEVFDRLYFSDAWQSVFAVDNSMPLWGLLLGVCLWRKWPVGVAFAGAGLLHLVTDLLLHNEDARMQFWPISTWVFRSPVSYWDPRHHGRLLGPVEIAVCLGLSVVLWRKFRSGPARMIIVSGALLESVPGILFALMMAHQ